MPQASYGVNAKVPGPTGVRAKTLPGSKSQGDSTNPRQGSSVDPDYEDTNVPGQKEAKSQAGEKNMMQGSSKISQPPQVTAEDIDFSDDVDALFEGTDLSEDFRERAVTIFETAVAAKVNEMVEEYAEELQEQYETLQEQISEDLVLKLDQYLDYVVEQWMEENELAVESGIKSEIAENILVGIKDLLAENYIEVPDEAEDLVDQLSNRVEELEDELNTQIDENVELKTVLKDVERTMIFDTVTEGLSDTQIAKLESLSEAIDYSDAEDFREKLETLCESYFPAGRPARASYDEEDPVDLNEEVTIPRNMQGYVSAISRTSKR